MCYLGHSILTGLHFGPELDELPHVVYRGFAAPSPGVAQQLRAVRKSLQRGDLLLNVVQFILHALKCLPADQRRALRAGQRRPSIAVGVLMPPRRGQTLDVEMFQERLEQRPKRPEVHRSHVRTSNGRVQELI